MGSAGTMTHDQLLATIEQAQQEGWTELNLNWQKLTELPPEIGQLTQLEQLFLHDNPALNIPPEVLGTGWINVRRIKGEPADPQEILCYYFAQ